MSKLQPNGVLDEWRKSATYWHEHIDTIRAMFDPVTQALIKAAGIVAGNKVLDIAGGSGEPSLTIAETVGPSGSVVFTDAVKEMVEAARREGQRRGLSNVSFEQCPAESLPFTSESFDSVVCRLGAMFFPDPLSALREMLRVTKRGGSISLAVWGRSELNPFFFAITDAVSKFVDLAPPDPNLPGAFRFEEPGVLAHIMKEAGAKNIYERLLNFSIEAPISPDQFWEMRSKTSGTLREKLATLLQPELDLIASEVISATEQFFPNGQMRFPAQMIIVTGDQPATQAKF